MTGKNKALGESLFNSAVLSLFENDLNDKIELILFDSKDSAIEAKKEFNKIIDQDIKIVIGPVFSSQIEAIANEAIKHEITVISMSNNRKLMNNIDENGGVFLSGMMPETQIDKIVSYALSRGKKSFAVMAPNNKYGITVSSLFKKLVKDRNGIFITSEIYSTNGKGIEDAAYRTINAFTVPSNMAEGGGNKLKEDFTVSNDDKTFAEVILIPDAGKNLSKIVRLLDKENINERPYQIIGTNQWDDTSTINDPYLVNSWFVAPDNEGFQKFERIYYQSYNKFPPRISSITYDAVLSVIKTVEESGKRNPKIQDFINYKDDNHNGFLGIDGLFRYVDNGLVQRSLAVLRVGKGKFEVLEKPTEDFLRY